MIRGFHVISILREKNMKGAAIAVVITAFLIGSCSMVLANSPLVPPVQYEQFCENQKVAGTGAVDVSTSIIDKKIALEYQNTMAGDGDLELNSEHAYSQDADKLKRNVSSINNGNETGLNLYENTKMTYSGKTPLAGGKLLNSKEFYGGIGANFHEMFSVNQMEKDEKSFFASTTPYQSSDNVYPENLIRDLKDAGRNTTQVENLMTSKDGVYIPSHVIGIETKNTFNGTWGTDARWHKIFYKDIKAHEMFTGKFEADKLIKFHEYPVPENGHGSCEGINIKTGDVKAFKQALEKDGFTVQEGEFGYVDLIKLYSIGYLPTAAGNNPTTKYMGYFVPPAPGHENPAIAPGYKNPAIAKYSKELGMSVNLSNIWNLRPDEAVVFVGRTPPECRYFSFDIAQQSGIYENNILWTWPSIGDTLNNLVIKTEGTLNGQPGNPFNQNTVIIDTADRGIDQRVRAAAQSAGYPDGIINTQVFPSSMLHMGVENYSDTFSAYIRPALYKDKQAGDQYLNNTPAVLLRITPNESTKLDPYKVPEQRARGAGTTEFDLMDDLEQLRNAILEEYSDLNARELPTSQWFPPSNDGFQKGINVYGPDNDACYLWTATQTLSAQVPWTDDVSQYYPFIDKYYPFVRDSEVTLNNSTNEFLIVYGVNHVATGKAMYSNCVVYGADGWNGVGAVTDLDLNGTAQAYLPDNPNAKYLYVYKVARNRNGDPHCLEVPTGPGAYGIGLDQTLLIGWRLYLEKATKTGPSYTEIVYDKAIKFDPKE
jgi:hypothetical protein